MSSFKTLEQESQDLALHVELCAQRYDSLDSRLVILDGKLDTVYETVNKLSTDLWKVLITTVGTTVASIFSVVIVLLLK